MHQTIINQRLQSYTDFKTHRMTPYKNGGEEMNQLKKVTSLTLYKHLYHRIVVISMVRKMFFGENDATISSIVNQAIDEYLKNHDEEIKKLMERYHDEGGCADL